jgi:hypothetical protein
LVEKSTRKPSQSLPKSALRNNKLKTSDENDKVKILSRATQEENSDSNARENDIMRHWRGQTGRMIMTKDVNKL